MKQHYAFATLLSFFLLFAGANVANAEQPADTSENEVKAKVLKRMGNGKRKVKVEMANGSKIKGNITAADADTFTLSIAETNHTSLIAYRDVAKLKGTGWPTSSKIALGVGAASAATLVVLYALFQHATRNN